MPSLSAETLVMLDELCREYRIHFRNDVAENEWPAHHSKMLRQVKQLGDIKFDHYAIDLGVTEEEPWKTTAKSLATLLVAKVNNRRQRNELTWRFTCEPLVFARLSGEVVCRQCRNRLWRADIEACRKDNDITAAALRARQNARLPCSCPRVRRGQDLTEAIGINRIFDYRLDEEVRCGKEITDRVRKQGQTPDAVYGLRRTRNIENLLHDTPAPRLNQTDSRQLHESLDASPFTSPLDKKGDPLLFPFLVVEAKSGKSDSDWYSIDMQTAFPIRAFLQTQDRLRQAVRRAGRGIEGRGFNPLVWFFSYRGEDWRLSMAYMEERNLQPRTVGTMEFHVVEVWRGSISNSTGALQLLLLVDYIFDWARDIYREDIIQHLRILASGENDAASGIYIDSAILSNFREAIHEAEEETTWQRQSSANYEIQRAFMSLNPTLGVVRHASLIESRFSCIMLTADNWSTFFKSTGGSLSSILFYSILYLMEHGVTLMDSHTLRNMEKIWTGTSRPILPIGARFLTAISYNTYISPTWNLIRELNVIAIAESLLQSLFPGKYTSLPPVSPEEGILQVVEELRAGSIFYALNRAVERRAMRFPLVSFKLNVKKGNIITGSLMVDNMESDMDDPEVSPNADHAEGYAMYHACQNHSQLRSLVLFVYGMFKKGTTAPQEPFLVYSRRLDQQNFTDEDSDYGEKVKEVELLRIQDSNNIRFPPSTPRVPSLRPAGDGYVLVHGLGSFEDCVEDIKTTCSDICVFLTRQPLIVPTDCELRDRIKNAVEKQDVYHTTRDNGPSNLSTACSFAGSSSWNLNGTYGIYSQGNDFCEILRTTRDTKHLPKFQGSSRQTQDSGLYNFCRELFPWTNIKQEPHRKLRQDFVLFKILQQEFNHWRHIAEGRRASGIHCCLYCAVILHTLDDVCLVCQSALGDQKRPFWFKWAVVGHSQHSYPSTESGSIGKDDFEEYPELFNPIVDISGLDAQWSAYQEWRAQINITGST